MAFFDEFNKRVSGIAQSAQKTAEVAKIQHQVSQKQAEFDSLYHQIGQLYYSCHQRGIQPDESIVSLCDRVTALAQEIDKLRGKIDEIRNVCRCAACGNVVERGAAFCSKCGAKLEVKEPEKPAQPEPEQEEEDAADKDVYINWPEAKPEQPAEEPAPEEGGEPDKPEQPGEPEKADEPASQVSE
ncbi:MAG: zinc ribbon domain-containing protein [Clostridia bacterium]|nr:zinc ribbon domain-containing protein [Clostridia bacterium]